VRAEEKAVRTYAELYQRYTVKRDMVVDFFAGPFTSALAALNCDRCYLGCESHAACYEVAITRLQRYAQGLQEKRWKEGFDEILPLTWPEYICPPHRSLSVELGTPEQPEYDTPASKAELAAAQVRTHLSPALYT
jgi:hypothetical protein